MEKDYIEDIDQIREKEYPLLQNTTYLDHAGTTLYSKSLVQQFSTDLCGNLFGNPHSASPSSSLSTERVENVRFRVLDFFKANPEHFDVVFVANATAGIKLVMSAFQDYGSRITSQKHPGFWYGYHSDAHTSLVGVRQVAFAGSRCFRSDEEVENWLEYASNPVQDGNDRPKDSQLALFAYPAQSNMNGHRLPLSWTGRVRSSTHPTHKNMYTMLDAAAYVTSAQLDLSDVNMAPDFTVLSFYKIFGFPDLGAVIIRKSAGHILQQRRYFGGGTVEMVIAVDTAWHAKKPHELHEELEDGTLPFHNIIALDAALDTHERLYGSMSRVSAHTCYLAKLLYERLQALHHGNGLPVCEIYKHATSTYGDSKTQAPTIAFNVRNGQGGWIGKSDFEKLAIVRGIQLRTGGVCNPGGIATNLVLKPWELRRNFAEGVRCGNDFDLLGGKPTGIVRVSLGAMSNLRDVDHFIRFVREVFVESTLTPEPVAELKNSSLWKNAIQSITIYPLRGSRGWQVPKETAWEVKEAGLAWDGEWCLVSEASGETLTVEDYPALRHLEPSLHVEDGYLKISVDADLTGTSNSTISVSLWESPPASEDMPLNDLASPRADPYPSKSLAAFFTSFLGFPCTLARYPDYRKLKSQQVEQQMRSKHRGSTARVRHPSVRANEQPRRASSIVADLPTRNPIMISISRSSTSTSNITTTSSLDTSWQYIRIGPHYFLSLPNSTSPQSQVHRNIRHLHNVFDQSIAAQNPTIRVGDAVQTFSANSSSEDAGLRACIASIFAADFICPVPSCRKQMGTKEEKSEHLLVHRIGNASEQITPMKAGEGRRSLRKQISATKREITSSQEWSGTTPSGQLTDKGKRVENGGERTKHIKWKKTFSFRSMVMGAA